MNAFKVKEESSKAGVMTKFPNQPAFGSVKIQSVFYSSANPSQTLFLYDKDGDLFLFPVPGQIAPSPIGLEAPVTVNLPIHYLDPVGGNEIILFGEM